MSAAGGATQCVDDDAGRHERSTGSTSTGSSTRTARMAPRIAGRKASTASAAYMGSPCYCSPAYRASLAAPLVTSPVPRPTVVTPHLAPHEPLLYI